MSMEIQKSLAELNATLYQSLIPIIKGQRDLLFNK